MRAAFAARTGASGRSASAPSNVAINSTGAGNKDTNAATTKTTSWAHTVVAGSNRRMYASVFIGHNNWVNPSGPTLTSDRDGALTLVSRVDYGNDSGWRLGHTCLFSLDNPSTGAHTLTASTSAGQTINLIAGSSIVVNNAASIDAPVTQAQTSANGQLSLSVTPAAGDMALLIGAWSSAPTITAPGDAPWYADGLSINGDVDYWRCFAIAGTGDAVAFTSSTSTKVGAIATVIRHAA